MNESMHERKILTFSNPEDEDDIYSFGCSLWKAGGDWQSPVAYFKVQLLKGYMKINSKLLFSKEPSPYKEPWFVAIPPAAAGNCKLLQRKGKDNSIGWSPIEMKDNIPKEIEQELIFDNRKMWKWLEGYLAKIINKRLLLKEMENQIYDAGKGKIGYEESQDKAMKELATGSSKEMSKQAWKNMSRDFIVSSTWEKATLMIDVPNQLKEHIQSIKVPKELLTGDGKIDDTHVTLLYGIPDNESYVKMVQDLIQKDLRVSSSPIITYFDNGQESVAKVDINSTDLRWAHFVLKSKLPNEHKYFYSPHVTIAYINKKARLQDSNLPKTNWKVDTIIVSHRDGEKEKVKLS